MKKALVVGSWAKEQITIENLRRDPEVVPYAYMDTLNPGIRDLVEEYRVGPLSKTEEILDFARQIEADIVIPTTASPLAAGLTDLLETEGFTCFGPRRQASKLEFDKAFTRDLLSRRRVGNSPAYKVCRTPSQATDVAEGLNWEVAVKPIGLTEGLGVRVAGDQLKGPEEVRAYIERVFEEKIGGNPAVIIEEKLSGIEFTLQCLVNDQTVLPLPLVQDFKKLLPGEKGPNTASMGSFSHSGGLLPYITAWDYQSAFEVIEKTLQVFKEETGEICRGFLYGQFMLTTRGIYLIEYNFRPGDPEWMDVMLRLEGSLLRVIEGLLEGRPEAPGFKPVSTVCKYLVPEGYPAELNLSLDLDLRTLEGGPVRCYYSAGLDEAGCLQVGTERGIALLAESDRIEKAHRLVEDAISKIEGKFFHREDIGSLDQLTERKNRAARIQSERIVVRTGKETDFLPLNEFTRDCAPLENYPAHIYRILLRYFGHSTFIMELEDRLAGFALSLRSSRTPSTCFIWQIGVDPKLQGSGLGKLLLKETESRLGVDGVTRIELTIDPENIPSRRLFESAGYRNASSKEGETVQVGELEAVKDFYSPGRHFMLFEKEI